MKGKRVIVNNVEYTIVHQTLNGYLCIDAIGNNRILPTYLINMKLKEQDNV